MSDTQQTQENQLDENFFQRADEYINLANTHLQDKITPGLVTNSMMFASSRFNAWVAAAGFKNSEEMQDNKEEIIEYFTNQYKLMLEDNYNNYVQNFDSYMKPQEGVEKK